MPKNNNFSNYGGTVVDSFKIGAKGVSLYSSAIISGNKAVQRHGKYLYVEDIETGESNRLAYDYELPTNCIESYEQSPNGNEVTFNFKDGSKVTVARKIESDIIHPETSTPKDIVLFGNEHGNELIDSNIGIIDLKSEDFNSIDKFADELVDDKVVTAKAVLSYVGNITDILSARMEGKDISVNSNENQTNENN